MRIQDYAHRNLSDPDLTPARIAVAHNISQRQLYMLFSQAGETPAEWIIARRLETAKIDLTYRPDTVLNIALRWGFKDPSHFSRRFKATYGVTPYEYSRRVRENTGPFTLGLQGSGTSPDGRTADETSLKAHSTLHRDPGSGEFRAGV